MEILLVEDNPGDILLIKTVLEEADNVDANLTYKTNGLEASNYITQVESVPDLVILDLNLPYKSGFELLQEIRNNMKFNTTPVIIFTSSTSEIDIEKAHKMEAEAYFSKSVDIDEYRMQVISFLNYVQK